MLRDLILFLQTKFAKSRSRILRMMWVCVGRWLRPSNLASLWLITDRAWKYSHQDISFACNSAKQLIACSQCIHAGIYVRSLGKPVSLVFPRVLMFPETKSRETSGLRFWAQIFLLENAEFTKRLLLREYTGVVNNPSSTKLSDSKLKNAVLNPSRSLLVLKKVSPRILSTFKRSFSKKWEKHWAHTLSTR